MLPLRYLWGVKYTNVMLRGCNHALSLNTLDRRGRGGTLQVRVRSEAFPVAPTSWHAAERAHGRAKENVNALKAGLETVELPAFLPNSGVSLNYG